MYTILFVHQLKLFEKGLGTLYNFLISRRSAVTSHRLPSGDLCACYLIIKKSLFTSIDILFYSN